MFSRSLILLLLLVATAFAQEAPKGIEDFMEDTADPEGQIINLPVGAVLSDSPPLDHIIEGVGTVVYSTVPIHSAATKTSRIIRFAVPGEKMIVTANNEDWYSIRMYNGREGFIERRNLKTVKVFYDESVTTNYMNKRLNVELHEIVKRFNRLMNESIFLEKFQLIPRILISNSSTRRGTITITLEYSAVDSSGNIIPSRQANVLNNELQKLVELIFMKMLPTKVQNYVIIIKKPLFSDDGHVINVSGEYATLTLKAEDATIAKIKESPLLTLTESTMPVDELFREYPY
ncbi:MAG: SH3 domain-containing protein [Deferribacteraceae bacterium]|nr:SH3 domain-containing protein [Deferribacteraceae bacterium]